MDQNMEWIRDLQGILGELASLERRLQSQPESVSDSELRSAAEKVDQLQTLVPSKERQKGTWDVFYRKYNALLHPYLQARGMRPHVPTPPVWDFDKAMEDMMNHFSESESKLQTVKFVSDLYRVVEQLDQAAGSVTKNCNCFLTRWRNKQTVCLNSRQNILSYQHSLLGYVNGYGRSWKNETRRSVDGRASLRSYEQSQGNDIRARCIATR